MPSSARAVGWLVGGRLEPMADRCESTTSMVGRGIGRWTMGRFDRRAWMLRFISRGWQLMDCV